MTDDRDSVALDSYKGLYELTESEILKIFGPVGPSERAITGVRFLNGVVRPLWSDVVPQSKIEIPELCYYIVMPTRRGRTDGE